MKRNTLALGALLLLLPAVASAQTTARVVFAHTVVLVACSLVPAFHGMGPWYLAGAIAGGLNGLLIAFQQLAHISQYQYGQTALDQAAYAGVIFVDWRPLQLGKGFQGAGHVVERR